LQQAHGIVHKHEYKENCQELFPVQAKNASEARIRKYFRKSGRTKYAPRIQRGKNTNKNICEEKTIAISHYNLK
jgi:hypothetical protein